MGGKGGKGKGEGGEGEGRLTKVRPSGIKKGSPSGHGAGASQAAHHVVHRCTSHAGLRAANSQIAGYGMSENLRNAFLAEKKAPAACLLDSESL